MVKKNFCDQAVDLNTYVITGFKAADAGVACWFCCYIGCWFYNIVIVDVEIFRRTRIRTQLRIL